MQLHFLTEQAPTGDPYALLLLGVLVIALVVYLIIKSAIKKKQQKADENVPAPTVQETPQQVAPGSAGQLKLHDVEPKTAAMLMAIVADKLGKPLNELRFISIKEVKDDEV